MRESLLFCLVRRVVQIARRRSLEATMDDEMRYHIECEAAERIRHGVHPEEAWRTAARDFGGVERHKEDARDVRGVRLFDDIARDTTYAIRVLRRNPGFSLAVVLTFALGIGCTSAIFSLVNGILLRPLPYAEPSGLVTLWERNDARKGRQNVVAVATFDAWRTRTRSFVDVAALVPAPLTLDGAPAERIKGAEVSPGYFRMLGVRPAIGRDFEPADEADGGAPVTILSDALWRRRYGADPSIVGKRISVDGSPVTVIGVMGDNFDPPRFGWMADQPLWLPFASTEANRSWGRFLHVVARLRPGVSIEQARAEMAVLSERLARDIQQNRGWSSMVVPLEETISGGVRRPLIVLFAAVALLLVMSTVNVASLVTAFALGRRHELVVRRAVGATPTRLVRQQLVQSAVLGVAGTIVGLALAYAGTRGLVALAPPSVPRLTEVSLNGTVVAFASALAIATTIVFGAIAALRALSGAGVRSSIDLAATTRANPRGGGSRIIAAEIAVGLVVTVLATLMVRSLVNLRSVDLGFDAGSVVTGRVSLPSKHYPDDERQHAFFAELVTRARAIPGVTHASVVTTRPFACCAASTPVRDPAQAVTIESAPIADVRWVDDSYFSTVRIPILSGANFEPAESRDGPIRAVVSLTLARTLWGNADPVGKTIALNLYGTTTARVIGLVGDVHLVNPRTPVRPAAYLSTERFANSERDIVVRGVGDAGTLLTQLRAAVASVDVSIPLYQATSLDASISEAFAQDRFTAVLLGAFAVLSLVLAAIGVYGVLAGDVGRRRKEIGIRLALGARATEVTTMVLRRALRPAAIGAVLGVFAALALAQSMSALVFGIATWDPLSFVVVTGILLVVATLATLSPAVRATRVSPIEAIRTD